MRPMGRATKAPSEALACSHVEAETNRAADGEFRLRVIFREELFVNTLAGDYDLTITGTIVPK